MVNRKTILPMILLLCCALMLSLTAAAAEPAGPMTLEYYQSAVPNDDPARAYVELTPYENPIYQIFFEDVQQKGWYYSYTIREVNGVPFTMKALAETMYDAAGEVLAYQRMEDLSFFHTQLLENGEWQEFGMRIHEPTDVRWIAYQLDGTDANGKELSFHCLYELLREEKPVKTLAEFQVEQHKQEGKPFMVLGSDPSPVYAVKDENNAEVSHWWQYHMVFENTGDAPFAVSTLNEVVFNGESVMIDSQYEAQSVAGWCDQEDCVIEPGEHWVIECAMPVQDLTAVGMRLTGTDANGEEMSFVGMFELLHEMKTE